MVPRHPWGSLLFSKWGLLVCSIICMKNLQHIHEGGTLINKHRQQCCAPVEWNISLSKKRGRQTEFWIEQMSVPYCSCCWKSQKAWFSVLKPHKSNWLHSWSCVCPTLLKIKPFLGVVDLLVCKGWKKYTFNYLLLGNNCTMLVLKAHLSCADPLYQAITDSG